MKNQHQINIYKSREYKRTLLFSPFSLLSYIYCLRCLFSNYDCLQAIASNYKCLKCDSGRQIGSSCKVAMISRSIVVMIPDRLSRPFTRVTYEWISHRQNYVLNPCTSNFFLKFSPSLTATAINYSHLSKICSYKLLLCNDMLICIKIKGKKLSICSYVVYISISRIYQYTCIIIVVCLLYIIIIGI